MPVTIVGNLGCFALRLAMLQSCYRAQMSSNVTCQFSLILRGLNQGRKIKTVTRETRFLF